jgi:hypothetical protein
MSPDAADEEAAPEGTHNDVSDGGTAEEPSPIIERQCGWRSGTISTV